MVATIVESLLKIANINFVNGLIFKSANLFGYERIYSEF